MHERRLAPLATLALTFLVLSACAGSGQPDAVGPDFVTRDSAGVELAVTTYAEPAPVTGWTISDVPEVVYGESADDPVDFTWIRSAIRLPDGVVAAVDAQANQLFFFEPTGGLIARAGGTGDGPGEFHGPAGLAHLGGDSLLVYDRNHMRFSVFRLDGTLVDDRRLELPSSRADAPQLSIYAAADGSDRHVILVGQGYVFAVGRTGEYTIENPTLLYHPDGTYVDQVGEATRFWLHGTSERSDMHLFGGWQQVRAGGGRVYVGDRTAYEIRVHEPDAGLVRILRLERPRRPVTDQMVGRHREWLAGRIDDPERRRSTLERFDRRPVADSLNWIGGLEIDALGNVWVAEARVTGDDPLVTTVFAADGEWLGTVDVPDDFMMLEIGEDYVLGSLRDELDVQHLVRYGLEREPAPMEPPR